MRSSTLVILGYIVWLVAMFYYSPSIEGAGRVIICICVTIGWSIVAFGATFDLEFRNTIDTLFEEESNL